jgi:hypothetical protein
MVILGNTNPTKGTKAKGRKDADIILKKSLFKNSSTIVSGCVTTWKKK